MRMAHRFAHAAFVLLPGVLFGWLAWQELVPTGEFRLSWEPGDRSAFIDPIRPDQRVERPVRVEGFTGQRVTGDPVYTFIHPHREFTEVSVDIHFDPYTDVPIVEAGALVSADGDQESYDLQPVYNRLIEDSSWLRTDAGGVVLLQRKPTYASVAEFLAKPPAGKSIATYRYEGVLPVGTKRLLPSLDLDKERINFIIARYASPRISADGRVATATVRINPSLALQQRRAWKFALSVPDAETAPFTLRGLDVTFRRKNLVDTLCDKLPWL